MTLRAPGRNGCRQTAMKLLKIAYGLRISMARKPHHPSSIVSPWCLKNSRRRHALQKYPAYVWTWSKKINAVTRRKCVKRTSRRVSPHSWHPNPTSGENETISPTRVTVIDPSAPQSGHSLSSPNPRKHPAQSRSIATETLRGSCHECQPLPTRSYDRRAQTSSPSPRQAQDPRMAQGRAAGMTLRNDPGRMRAERLSTRPDDLARPVGDDLKHETKQQEGAADNRSPRLAQYLPHRHEFEVLLKRASRPSRDTQLGRPFLRHDQADRKEHRPGAVQDQADDFDPGHRTERMNPASDRACRPSRPSTSRSALGT